MVSALLFDVFGTVVDWRSGVIRDVTALTRARGAEVDAAAFADAWRAGYAPAMDLVRRGELPWTKLDDLHRRTLDRLLAEFGLSGLSEDEKTWLNTSWHRLDPWPDSVPGLLRLKQEFVIAAFSNGNVSLLVDMARRAALPWDFVFSAELFRHYKPHPECYRGAVELLSRTPSEVMLVAAHNNDLQAAAGQGLATAFVARPDEGGPDRHRDRAPSGDYTCVAADLEDLAERITGTARVAAP
ncbi:MAG: haloacid dehalogenase type II [Streptosporangiaceae bacterium]